MVQSWLVLVFLAVAVPGLAQDGVPADFEPSLIPLELVEDETGVPREKLVNREVKEQYDLDLERGLPKSVLNTNILTPIKQQGGRGTCTAFATIAALEGVFGGKVELSEQHLYYQIKKFYFPKVDGIMPEVIHLYVEALNPLCVVAEADWPYNPQPVKGNIPQGPPPAGLEMRPQWCIEQSNHVGMVMVRNVSLLKAVLAEGNTVLLTVLLPMKWQEMWRGPKGLVDPGKLTWRSFVPVSAHSILLVGYDEEDRIIFRNSWGKAFGNQGYGTFSRKYLQMYATSGFFVLEAGTK
ncbi:MAG: hypothetical protein A2284_18530 [Deltaproteobacteria bacterium RIFOXYA12_FULL_61_11]|nr:MAG: hypothetical protein A2284_18530 [Deltaproteobacteria bacterium RIFOXYA12_FULL_61_11]